MRIKKFILPLLFVLVCVFGSFARTYNVKDYGAKGDGKKDDSKSIQQCIDLVEENGGGVVYFPSGTYIVSRTSLPGKAFCIRSSSNIVFAGQDYNSAIIRLADKQGRYTSRVNNLVGTRS